MKIIYAVHAIDENSNNLQVATYKTEIAARRLAKKYRRANKVRTIVVELIKERGQDWYGNEVISYWPLETN